MVGQVLGTGRLSLAPDMLRALAERVEKCGCPVHVEKVEKCGCSASAAKRLRAMARSGHEPLRERVERAPLEQGEVLGEGELGVDVAAMWRMMTQKLYGSNDLVALATREAMQNGVDAIRMAYRARMLSKDTGRFAVTWTSTGETGTLTFEDNGIGMDLDVLRTKFLVLGASGKSGDAEAAGGFGAAKAVILGVTPTGNWLVHTRTFGARPKPGSLKYDYLAMPERQGTEIVLHDVPAGYTYSRMFDRSLDVPTRIKNVLALSDVPDVTLVFNGDPVSPMFPRRKGSHLDAFEQANWGAGTTASVKSYRRGVGTGSGAFYIRLNGLFQFVVAPAYGTVLKSDVVIDLTTTTRPESNDYPLNASRDRFNSYAQASNTFEELMETFQRESKTADDDREYDTLLDTSETAQEQEGGREFAGALQEVAESAEFQAMLQDLLGVADEFYHEQAKTDIGTGQTESGALGVSGYDPYASFRDVAAFVGVPDLDLSTSDGQTKLVEAVLSFVVTAGGGPETEQGRAAFDALDGVLAHVAGGGALYASDVDQLVNAINGVDAATSPVGSMPTAVLQDQLSGLVVRAAEETVGISPDATQAIKQKARRSNPFGKAGAVKVSRKNYDKAKARRFLQNAKKWQPYLVLWDLALRLIAKEGRVKINFKPGFVLDNTVRALASTEGAPGSRTFTNFVLVNPDGLAATVKTHKDRPSAIATYVHNIACHELAHLPRMGQGHGEAFVVEREDLAVGTGHLLPAIEQIVIKALKLEPPMPPLLKQAIRDAERQAKEKAAERVQARLRAANAKAREVEDQLLAQQSENARLRALVDGQLASVIAHLRAVAQYHGFADYVRNAGRALLPVGLSPDAFLRFLDEHPMVAADTVLAWARRAG